ncbi:tRNA(Ile)-lysidine synthetase [Enhygromyxa salina]|uniref:tRNA(Ile)-lysidine synthase n=1 Tax=Enhygromyxa salina TaxID=215803 RepID=A0A0C1ZIQ0_9BACT|nr:tRNA lysidine(34) synthetase TilS [Enhygromyxa salina]KIG17414.1 tRNA(Ile)-lysidine synthetase [Enhygromyxa salina]
MLDVDAPPHSPEIAGALGVVRGALREAFGSGGGGRRLLVGCSGGRDSVAALGLLMLLRRSEGLELTVGHVDHGLRPESAAEGDFVAGLAAQLGLVCLRTRVELEPGVGVPERARVARRLALEQQAARCGAQAIVLGHTATDQAETMLMHLTRGAGLEGLAAMAAHEGPWLRPLLGLSRAQTKQLCAQLGLGFVDDPTNADTRALRVWLRELVLPRLREQNPQVEFALLGLARQAEDAELALVEWASAEVERRSVDGGWDLGQFHTLPRAVRTRALRRVCELSGVDLTGLRRRVIEAMDIASVAVSRSLAGGPGTPSPAPRGWDLRPGCRIEIGKKGVHASQRGTERGTANH